MTMTNVMDRVGIGDLTTARGKPAILLHPTDIAARMNYTFASATILLILITDPIGNIPIFANALKHVAPERRARVILREVLIAFLLLLTFMFIGDSFLRVMNLSELSLQIGGGGVL